MSLTIIQKSDPAQKKDNPKIALVLSGGSLSGGAHKIGGLKALNDYLVNRKLTDFDIYVAMSAGAFLAVPLVGGISPEEMLASLDGKSKKYSQLSPFDLYMPNTWGCLLRPIRYLWGQASYLPGVFFDVSRAVPRMKEQLAESGLEFIRHPNYSNYERFTRPLLKIAYSSRRIPTLGEIMPSGFFDNRPLEAYLARNMKRNKMPNNFRVIKRMTGKSLYITAMDLDTSERVFFGPDEKNDVSISEAVQASTAIPGFYKPARIKGVDYVDGGIRKTAHIDFASDKGADLIVCYNPFKPYNNNIFLEYIREDNKYITKNKRISDYGLGTILNQVFRTVFHSRLQAGLRGIINDPNFKKDVVVIEPDEDYNDITTLNPLFFWNRAKAAKIGFDSVATTIERHFDELSQLFGRYGIQISRDQVERDQDAIKNSNNDDQVIMDVLETPSGRGSAGSAQLKIVRGGRS